MFKKIDLKTLIFIVSFIIFVVFTTSCSNAKESSTRESLINATRGALYMISADYKVYKKAIDSPLTPVTKELLYSTLLKMAIIKGYEKESGRNYKIENDMNIHDINQICWAGSFLIQYKKYIPKELGEYSVYEWVNTKHKIWKAKLHETFGDRLIEDDCRSFM